MDDPKELLNQIARDRERVLALLQSDDDGSEVLAIAAMMHSTFNTAESLTEIVIELVDRLAPTLLDLRERVEALESKLLPPT